jgi:hypothetical protein
MGWGVRTTWRQRVIGVVKTSMWGHGLGVEFIRQVIQGGTLGELEGTKGQQIEYYVQAEYARSWSLLVCWGRIGLVPAGYVRSFSRRPWTILMLSERQSAVMRRVWSAGMVTLCAGGLLTLLLDASWRVWRAKCNYRLRWQIWSKANDIWAEISYSRLRKDSKLIYLESLDGGSRYGVSKYRGEKVGAGAPV